MGVSKTSDNMQMKINIPNSSQAPPASSKAPNMDLKDMDVLCTLKIKIESRNSEHGYIKDPWPYPNQDQDANSQSGTSSVLQSHNQGFKDMDVLCSFKIKIETQNMEHWYIKYQWTSLSQSKLISFSEQNLSESNFSSELLWADLS